MTIYQIAILLYVLLYFGIILGLRAYLLYRETGIRAFKNTSTNSILNYNSRVISMAMIAIPIVVFNYAFIENNYQYLIPID